jgi:hypothetical protein|tara:strand:+ start:328 stop:522 length:195 start_codon:yes stop_codon:yes gene_type:complete
MLKSLKRILNLKIIEWVNNTQKEYAHLEADQYFLVESSTEGPMLFTKHQVAAAKKRAIKNKEDI